MYEVNSIALRMMEKILERPKLMFDSVKRINEGKEYFAQEMRNLGFDVVDTHANFVHVKFDQHFEAITETLDRSTLYRKNISHPCLEGYSRLTTAPIERMRDVVNQIKTTLQEG